MTSLEQASGGHARVAGADARELADGRAPKARKVPHPTEEERAARGKAVRAEQPRSAHGEWEPASDRRDPAELLEEQAASPVPELVPIHYGRMLVSPFTFFRGAAYPMTPIWPAHPEPGWTCSSAAMPIVMGRRRTGQR